ncbi:MAG: glycosyltransferase, partial [Bacteroidota bacterium]
VLTIFGGGNALKWKRDLVNKLDRYLKEKQISVCWLFLGGVPTEWFKVFYPVIGLGRLSEVEISHWLQSSDIFLVPHECGLNAKRSTVMAALEHGLPIVGTSGYMTDRFWNELDGVTLVPVNDDSQWCESVAKLCVDPLLRQNKGYANSKYYYSHLTWEKIANMFLGAIG